MNAEPIEWVHAEDEPSARELQAYYQEEYERDLRRQRPWVSEPWAVFRETAEEEIDWLVEGLLPAGAFSFIAAPPKKGKTWLALYAAIAISSGSTLFSTFSIPEPRTSLYVALEGSRAALRARTGCLARGLGIDPESDALERLHMLYRPRPFDLARPESAEWLEAQVDELEARFVVIDVLRAAARFRENVAEDFAVVRDSFEGMLRSGVTIAVLHHFGKSSEQQRDRSPGERMAGTGAMYGALDVGLLITRSEDGARRLRVEVDARDFAAPDALGIVLEGTGTAEHGGFRYTDTAKYAVDMSAAEERDYVLEIERLFMDGEWRTLTQIQKAESGGIGAQKDTVREVLESHPERFVQIAGELVGRHKTARPWGTIAMGSEVVPDPGLPGPPQLFEGSHGVGGEVGGPPTGGTPTDHLPHRHPSEVARAPDHLEPPGVEF